MAKRIGDLPWVTEAVDALTGSELLEIEIAGESYKGTPQMIADLLGEVASTAEGVSVTDANGYFDGATDVQGALDSLGARPIATDVNLRGDLEDGETAGKGAALVAFTSSGTGAEARRLDRKVGDIINALDFIPEAEHDAIRAFTSTYDCTAGIQAAYARAKEVRGRCVVPAGLYRVSSTITLDGQASFVGEGSCGANQDVETFTSRAATLFRWTGAAGGTVIEQAGRIGGIDIGNFSIACNGLADIGILFDRLTYSRILPINVAGWRANQTGKAGFMVKVNPASANDNFMFNDIGPLYLRGPTCCFRLASYNSNSNSCHNTFRTIICDCRSGTVNTGMVIEDADNNSFLMTYTAVFNYPTDYGLELPSALARSNYFFHFQGAIKAKSGSKNIVFGFDRENGQPQPTVESGAELFWTESGNNAALWNLTEAMRNLQAVVEGNVSTSGLGPDPSRFSIVRAATNTITGIGFTSTGLGQLYHSPDGTNLAAPIQWDYNKVGFMGAVPVARPTVSGSRGGNAALDSLLTALAALGLITNSTTA